MAIDERLASAAAGSASYVDLAKLHEQKHAARRAFQSRDNVTAYTAPRALSLFMGSRLPELSSNTACWSGSSKQETHEMFLVPSQTYENEHTHFVSMFCRFCRRHFHVKSQTKYSLAIDTHGHPTHMLVPCQENTADDPGADELDETVIGYARFVCAVDDCHFSLEICHLPPKLDDNEIDMLKDNGRVSRNLERARAQDAARYSDVNEGYGLGAPGTLHRYLFDALKRQPEEPPLKIKKRNKKFIVAFSTDFDPLLRRLAFQERDDDQGEPCWFVSQPEEAQTTTPIRTLRAHLEDTLAELTLHTPEASTTTAWGPLLNAFQGNYFAVQADPVTLMHIKDEDLVILGCLRDYLPPLFSWAAILLAKLVPGRRESLLDAAARCIQERSHDALMNIALFRSEFDSRRDLDRQVEDAFRFFQTSPTDGRPLNHFATRLVVYTESNPQAASQAQAHFQVVSDYIEKENARRSNNGMHGLQGAQAGISSTGGANNRRLSIGSATTLLGVDASHSADWIRRRANDCLANLDRLTIRETLLVLADLKFDQGKSDEAGELRRAAETIANDATQGVPGTQMNANSANTPSGLINIGNTCYLNSLLQYVYNVKVLRELVLNYEELKLDLAESTVSQRRTGGNGTGVNLEEAIVARQFIESLRDLFVELQKGTGATARPSQKLANIALSSTKGILSEQPENKPPPLPARPSPAPPVPPKEELDQVNVTVEAVNDNDQLETVSSRSSQTLVNDGEDTRIESYVQVNHGDTKDDTVKVLDDQPSPQAEKTRPSTAQPNADIATNEEIQSLTLDEKMSRVSRTLEQSVRSGTTQQDVEEIMGNILEHIMRAIRPDGEMPGKPDLQADKITETFFTMVVNYNVGTLTRANSASAPEQEQNNFKQEVVPERMLIAYPHDKEVKKQIDLYEALDQYFSYELLSEKVSEDGAVQSSSRYSMIRALPPIVHICIQRGTGTSGVKNNNPVTIPEDLFLDRYMEAKPHSELWRKQQQAWMLHDRRKDLDSRAKFATQNPFEKPDSTNDAQNAGHTTLGKPPDNNSSGESDVIWNPDSIRDILQLDESLMADIARPNKRTASEASLVDVPQSMPPRGQSDAPPDDMKMSNLVDFLAIQSKSLAELNMADAAALRDEEAAIFDSMREQKYRLHAVICHRGGMGSGHYWVWIRDFATNIWYSYNDEYVSEDRRTTEEVLQDVSNDGSPYYVAYVRDEMIDDLVDMSERKAPDQEATPTGSQDVEMQTIEGVAPDATQVPPSSPTTYATSVKAIDGSDPPPYEIL